MNKLDFYIAINAIDEKLIAEANEEGCTEKYTLPYKKIFSLGAKIAAVIAVVICAAIYNHNNIPILPTANSTTITNERINHSTTQNRTESADTTVCQSDETSTLSKEAPTDMHATDIDVDSINTETTYPDYSLYTLSMWLNEPNVVWSNDIIKGESVISEKTSIGTVKITNSLKNIIKADKETTIYAVLVDFSSCVDEKEADTWKYNGISVSDLQANYKKGNYESKEDIIEYKNQTREIKMAYYNMKINSFKETFNNNGLNIYTDENVINTGSCYFYTFATEAQLNKFECKSDEAFVLAPAVKLK